MRSSVAAAEVCFSWLSLPCAHDTGAAVRVRHIHMQQAVRIYAIYIRYIFICDIYTIYICDIYMSVYIYDIYIYIYIYARTVSD
eukprot:COSAG06_NODE_11479_length_1503_cov_469.037037_2_plen_84_part_00